MLGGGLKGKFAKNKQEMTLTTRKKGTNAIHDLDNKRPSAVALAGVFPASTTLAETRPGILSVLLADY